MLALPNKRPPAVASIKAVSPFLVSLISIIFTALGAVAVPTRADIQDIQEAVHAAGVLNRLTTSSILIPAQTQTRGSAIVAGDVVAGPSPSPPHQQACAKPPDMATEVRTVALHTMHMHGYLHMHT